MSDSIRGYCPMGCGQTLWRINGNVHCTATWCPRPTAVTELLADKETDHIVDFKEAEFTVRHPLRERLDDALMGCELHDYIRQLAGPPIQPFRLGRYRARASDGGNWIWEAVPGPESAAAVIAEAGPPGI